MFTWHNQHSVLPSSFSRDQCVSSTRPMEDLKLDSVNMHRVDFVTRTIVKLPDLGCACLNRFINPFLRVCLGIDRVTGHSSMPFPSYQCRNIKCSRLNS